MPPSAALTGVPSGREMLMPSLPPALAAEAGDDAALGRPAEFRGRMPWPMRRWLAVVVGSAAGAAGDAFAGWSWPARRLRPSRLGRRRVSGAATATCGRLGLRQPVSAAAAAAVVAAASRPPSAARPWRRPKPSRGCGLRNRRGSAAVAAALAAVAAGSAPFMSCIRALAATAGRAPSWPSLR